MWHKVAALSAFALTSGVQAASYYVAPSGSDGNPGTVASPWKSIARAQEAAAPGDTIYFRGGDYVYTATLASCASKTDVVNAITLDKSGEQDKPIRYWAYPGETPVFDFFGIKESCRVKGFNVTANYLHLKGLELKGAPQQPGNLSNNESWGIWVKGSNNIFELLNTHHHMGPGFFLSNGSYNLVLNVDSHHNYDPYSKSGAGQNADGFGAHIRAGNPGNVFRGCRAWSNTDDGYDLINAYSPVLIENSWAWLHGYFPGTTTSIPAGNGNGFKVGGYSGVYQPNAPVHTVRFSVAFKNKANGFYANHHPVANEYYNNTSARNGAGFNMLSIDSANAAISLGVVHNNLAFETTPVASAAGADLANNSWNLPVSVTAADFQSVSTDGWDAPRLPDGSLPQLPFLRLAAGSDLIDKGVNLGLPFSGAAPDLGAFEGSTPVTLYNDLTASVKIVQSGLTLDRATQKTKGTVTFTNNSNATISGSLLFRVDYLTDGVTLDNKSGTQGGAPTLVLPVSALSPGQSATVTTIFANPNRLSVGYLPKLLAGTP
jgi:hypothetical protein